MTTPQRRLGSGFEATSTASEVLAGVDLAGKLFAVTGGASGLGLVVTQAVTNAGAAVVVLARRPAVALSALVEAGVARELVEVRGIDLADLGSVRAFAEEFLADGRDIDVLVNAAGVMACPETRVGSGWELQLATNHLGHYALTNHLWPALARAAGARVVTFSSAAHWLSPFRFDDPHFETGYRKWQAYGQSKTANSLFTVELDRRGRDRGVRAFAVHPGRILTPLMRHMSHDEQVKFGFVGPDGQLLVDRMKTPEQGASTAVWSATASRLEGEGGVYCEDTDVAELAGDADAAGRGVRGYAVDPDAAKRLWTLSAELTGVDAV